MLKIKGEPEFDEKVIIEKKNEKFRKRKRNRILKIETKTENITFSENDVKIEKKSSNSKKKTSIKPKSELRYCDLCPYQSNHKGHLMSHMKYRHCKGKVCRICKKLFDSQKIMLNHKEQEHPPVKCEFKGCKKKFSDKLNMKLHCKRIHLKIKKEKRIECDLCGWKTYAKNRMIDHIESRHLKKKYKCEKCEENFNTKITLRLHIKAKHRQFICEICDRIFNSDYLLIKHVKIKHLNEGNLIKCDKCPKKFTLKLELMRHKRNAHGKLRFKCEFAGCNKMFRRFNNMKDHCNIIHLQIKKEKRIECDICGWKSDRKCRMIDHIESHHLNKKYKCETCEANFNTKHTLNVHINSKHRENPL